MEDELRDLISHLRVHQAKAKKESEEGKAQYGDSWASFNAGVACGIEVSADRLQDLVNEYFEVAAADPLELESEVTDE